MHKEVYILGSTSEEDYKSFKTRVFKLNEDLLGRYELKSLKLSLTLKPPPGISVIPFKRKKVALISLFREEGPSMEEITKSEGFIGGYQVEEALPVSYSKTWDDRVATPGECLLTLFHRKPALDPKTFIHRWHEGHTPLSLKLHPLWNYNRNVVLNKVTENSLWYDGIVEEQFRNASDLLNPFVFFGPPLKVPLHMMQVWRDTKSFIDMKRIETYLTTEIHFKS